MKSYFVMTAALVLGLTVAAPPASASIVYSYVTDQTAYSGAAGTSITVNVYLNETLSGTSTSLITAQQGLYGAGAGIQLISGTQGSAISAATTNNNSATSVGTVTNGFVTPATAPGFGPNPPQGSADNNVSITGTNAALATAVGVAAGTGGGSAPAPGVTVINKGTLDQIYLGSFTINLGTSGTDIYTLTSLANSKNTVIGGFDGNTVTTLNGYDLDVSKTTGSASTKYTGADNQTSQIGGTGTVYTGYVFTVTANGSAGTPEPSSMALCGMAVCGLAFRAWRRRKGQIATEIDAIPEANTCATQTNNPQHAGSA